MRFAVASGFGLASGVLTVAAFFAMLYLYSFRAPDHSGFVVIGAPLGYATTVVTAAWYAADNDHNFSLWTLVIALSLGLLVGITVVLVAAFVLAFTALLRPPYMAGLLFLMVVASVTRYVLTRPRPYRR
ncbi:MAG: hypothetical protein EXR52_04365 [Dehalococcoidia bacterium]|nr:hypothetical protein [Dehalococcoidia bacterium]